MKYVIRKIKEQIRISLLIVILSGNLSHSLLRDVARVLCFASRTVSLPQSRSTVHVLLFHFILTVSIKYHIQKPKTYLFYDQL